MGAGTGALQVAVGGLVVLRLGAYAVTSWITAARRREAAFNSRVARLTPATLTGMDDRGGRARQAAGPS